LSTWTIDTGILIVSDDNSHSQNMACQLFLDEILKDDRLALDEGVLKEYEREALSNKKGNASIWFSTMSKIGRIDYYFDPEDKEAQILRRMLLTQPLPNGIGYFDSSDVPFVILCYRTPDRKITSLDVGEGDYSERFTNWIFEQFQIRFHDIIDSAPFYQSRHPEYRINSQQGN
jgi:hypothetical protein